MYYIHKHEVALAYGGPEEGGWWFDTGRPVEDFDSTRYKYHSEENAYTMCRELNNLEYKREDREEDYGYTSVLAYKSTHYAYSVHETRHMESYPKEIPYYE